MKVKTCLVNRYRALLMGITILISSISYSHLYFNYC